MITVGSLNRYQAAARFDFLGASARGCRVAIWGLQRENCDFVFWIHPEGQLFDATKDAGYQSYPKGLQWFLNEELYCRGVLPGWVVTDHGERIIVVHCRPEALADDVKKIGQFLEGIGRLPVSIPEDTLVISETGDIYGTRDDMETRRSKLSRAL